MLRSSLHSNKLSYNDLLLSKPLPPLIGAFDLLLVCIRRESHSLPQRKCQLCNIFISHQQQQQRRTTTTQPNARHYVTVACCSERTAVREMAPCAVQLSAEAHALTASLWMFRQNEMRLWNACCGSCVVYTSMFSCNVATKAPNPLALATQR